MSMRSKPNKNLEVLVFCRMGKMGLTPEPTLGTLRFDNGDANKNVAEK